MPTFIMFSLRQNYEESLMICSEMLLLQLIYLINKIQSSTYIVILFFVNM